MISTPTTTDLLAHADRHRDDTLALLRDLVRFETVNSRTSEEETAACQREVTRCFAYLGDWAARHGFQFRNYDDLVCVIERPGETEETIGVALHVDVVPAEGSWTHGPFSGDVADGAVWGRGTQDDKGPTATMLEVARLLGEAGVPFRRGLKLIIGSTEETAEWECIARYHAEEEEPSFTVVPDGEFPIIAGERGFLTLVLEGDYGDAEAARRPDGLRWTGFKSGKVENIVPDHALVTLEGPAAAQADVAHALAHYARGRGCTAWCQAQRLDDGGAEGDDANGHHGAEGAAAAGAGAGAAGGGMARFLVTFTGRAAHSSLPHLGQNAAAHAFGFVWSLFGSSSAAGEAARLLHEAGNDASGAVLGMAATHPFVGTTTAVLTWARFDGRRLEAWINTRFTFGETVAGSMAKSGAAIAARAPRARIALSHRPSPREPLYVDLEANAEFLDALRRSYEDVQRRPARCISIGGTTFAKAFQRAVTFGAVDPSDGEPELAHQVDERLRLDHLARNLRIYTLALARLVSADPTL